MRKRAVPSDCRLGNSGAVLAPSKPADFSFPVIQYWLLLAFPALAALAAPTRREGHQIGLGFGLMLGAMVLGYTLLALLRYRVGADWSAYARMYEFASTSDLAGTMRIADPLFATLLWLSARLGLGIYFMNGLCGFLLVYGVCRVSVRMREPWLAVCAAVPYILIVVGMGYIRQAAAIGTILIALASLARGRTYLAVAQLVVAALFHSTSVLVWPLFALAIAHRNRLRLTLVITGGALGFYFLVTRLLNQFSNVYFQAEYESSGAIVRILFSVAASLLLLVRWRSFAVGERVRVIWLGMATANLVCFVALFVSSSSTAIDRISLYFAPVQILVYGNLPQFLGFSRRTGFLIRFLALATIVAVQLVWLVFATHADKWVPYRSILMFA